VERRHVGGEDRGVQSHDVPVEVREDAVHA
jgi:hypothetical protein